MDYFGKNKVLLGIIAVLIVIDLVTLGTLWWMVDRQTDVPPKPDVSPKEFIAKELQFSPEQQKQFDQLVLSHQRTSREILEQLRNAKRDFFALVQRPSVSDSLVTAKAREIGRHESELGLVTLRHFQEIKGICAEQQSAKFDRIMQQVLQELSLPHPLQDGRGVPPPGMGGPPPDKRP